jgi:hypothetical protein
MKEKIHFVPVWKGLATPLWVITPESENESKAFRESKDFVEGMTKSKMIFVESGSVLKGPNNFELKMENESILLHF